ncbi:extracellular solute-binding protein [Streptomyces sp. NBC_01537]|uniref:extracellular solute-binding protein n=1 Tax=Streptomyces sp. NBC_01537 TaxID=2903896 RepID=UPI003863D786
MRLRNRLVAVVAGAALALTACSSGGGGGGGNDDRSAATDTTCDGKLAKTTYITAWFHESGAERDTLSKQVKAFNAAQSAVRVKLIPLPEGDYARQIKSAAATGNLPDVLDFDGPNLYNYAWSGKLKPIGSCIPKSLTADLLPTIAQQGTYARRMWGVGTYDSGLGLYVRRSALRKIGARIPTGPADAWTAAELTGILGKLRTAGWQRPLDLQTAWAKPGDEWFTYGFAPAIQSAGADLIDRTDYRTVDGVMNSPQAVGALTTMQGWAKAGLLAANDDKNAFTEGHSPISWVGHWVYDEFSKAFPGDVTIVPLPDFGRGTVTGMGSWQWGITADATDGDAAWRFLAFLLKPAEIHRMTQANGAIPATRSAVALSGRYAVGGPEHLYIEQLEDGAAVPRPQTPAYPAISKAYSIAFASVILDGRPVKSALDAAVRSVEQDLDDHQDYPTAAATGPSASSP